MSEGWTYAKAGVDLKEVKKVHKTIGDVIEETFKFRRGRPGEVVERVKRHYAGLIDLGDGRAVAVHADGVGTKVLVAQMLNRYDTVGIDAVAMNVNDLICVGAEPVALVDYLAVEKPDEHMIGQIMAGLAKGAEEAHIAIVGGEVAVMPDVIKGAVEGRGFDLAAMVVGLVDQKRIVTGEKLQEGDVVIGLQSSGIHSNGLSLARKILFESAGLRPDEEIEELGRAVGEELLRPTKIYVDPVLSCLKEVEVHALAHVTGGAFTKLRRVTEPYGFGLKLDSLPEPQPIFQLIQRLGNVPDEEMYRTFNMGVGFAIAVPKEEADDAWGICSRYAKAIVIGTVTRKLGIRLTTYRGTTLSL